jgi:5-methyltetrahydrofolate--homocysteine methyltransferase
MPVNTQATLWRNSFKNLNGFYFAHPASKYFTIGKIQKDQVIDYAKRKGMSIEDAEKWLSPVLGYDA